MLMLSAGIFLIIRTGAKEGESAFMGYLTKFILDFFFFLNAPRVTFQN